MTKDDSVREIGVTPMMAQYLALKEQAQDCLLFYRMGDFYELFFQDAEQAAACLDIALTSRGEYAGQKVPMCGVPFHAAENYLARLIRADFRVAIAEQVETPAEARKRGAKSLVRRDIVRIISAGTLTEENLLDARSSNWLAAACPVDGQVGLAWVDVSTGRFGVTSVLAEQLSAELARIGAAEVLVPDDWPEAPDDATMRARDEFDSIAGEARLKRVYGVATLDGFGRFNRAEQAVMGGLVHYLEAMGRGSLPYLAPPVRVEAEDIMAIDPATRESLELTRTATGTRSGSLLACIDRTVTGGGARLLAQDVSAPLTVADAINGRLTFVDWFVRDAITRERVRSVLKQLPDVERALGRLAAGRGGPRDLAQLRLGLEGASELQQRLLSLSDKPLLLDETLQRFGTHGALVDLLSRALIDEPPVDPAGGGFIAKGFDPALDELRVAAGDGRRAIASLEARYREQTSIAALKIKHNNVLGFHIEVPVRHADVLMKEGSGFTHRQTLAGVVRFNAAELHEQALRVTQAGDHAIATEVAHFETLRNQVIAEAGAISATAAALARIDVASALAERAAEGGWCRPIIEDTPVFQIQGGRHPVVEQALAKTRKAFVANDCSLGDAGRVWLVTGPNMGGKSTFLRQNALIAVLAQMGAFVPAESARIGIVDKLFSRVGASDNLAQGRSTFMVEMVETAAILSQATSRSFVILDEVGRGTSTYDGLAIAWSVLEAIHDVNRARCLFATHYHELTRLSTKLDALALRHVKAREWKGDLVFLHELAEGAADRSYGLAVARLAGMPAPVIARAKDVLGRLEQGREASGGLAAGLDDLPLFAAQRFEVEEEEPDHLRERMAELSPDTISPREALELIYELKRLASEG